MKRFPSIPPASDAPDSLFESGHLWILEKVDGAHLRFQLRSSGRLRFGDRDRVYDDPDEMPLAYRHAVRHVRDHLDRDALRRAVDDVESVVFFGEAMHRHAVDYDWARTPSVLGFDVWSAAEGAFRPPDAVERIFERLGLTPVNAVERERRARDFDPDTYSVPTSAWYDGPAAGVVVRNKRGQRATLDDPDVPVVDDTAPVPDSARELTDRYATRRRFERLVATVEDREGSVTVQRLYERAVDDIAREAHAHLRRDDDHGDRGVDAGAFRSAVAARTRAFLDEWDG